MCNSKELINNEIYKIYERLSKSNAFLLNDTCYNHNFQHKPLKCVIATSKPNAQLKFINQNTILNLTKQQLDIILVDKELFDKFKTICIKINDDNLYDINIG